MRAQRRCSPLPGMVAIDLTAVDARIDLIHHQTYGFMDPLSDVFSLFKAQYVASARLEVRGPWAMRFTGRRHIKFAGILEGAFWLWTDKCQPPLYLKAGDFFLLTRGQPYCTGSDPTLAPVDGRGVLASCLDADGVVRYGRQGDKVSAAGGRFMFDADAEALLLKLLPPLVHIPAGSQGAASLQALLELLRLETEVVRPGAAVIATNLANMVLMQSLRLHMASGEQLPGWLGALADPRIGATLRLLHADIARRWTVEELASSVAMSRTSFAQRFKALTGVPPLRYLIEWRMAVASTALRSHHRTISEVAESVGYSSAAAFSSVFFRVMGRRPGQYRADKVPDAP